jgi:RNA polymerase sigma factor (sigma-70 family)
MTVTDEMVRQWEPLVRLLAKEFLDYRHPSFEDICQEGRIGLLEAFERYDPTQAKFQTYARPLIRGAILHYFRGNGERGHDMVRTPAYLREQGYRAPVPASLDSADDRREPGVDGFEDRLLDQIVAEQRLAEGLPYLSPKRRECLLTEWAPGNGRTHSGHYGLAQKARKDLRTLIPAAERQRQAERRAATAAAR